MNKKIEVLMERLGKSNHYFEKMSEEAIDKLYSKNNMAEDWDIPDGAFLWDSVQDTEALQIASVIKFMYHLGYQPDYWGCKLLRFRTLGQSVEDTYNNAARCISVNLAIQLHNGINVGDIVMCSGDPIGNLNRYLSRLPIKISAYDYGVAKASKIVETAKLQFSRKRGIIVQSHKVRFASLFAKATHGHLVEEQE